MLFITSNIMIKSCGVQSEKTGISSVTSCKVLCFFVPLMTLLCLHVFKLHVFWLLLNSESPTDLVESFPEWFAFAKYSKLISLWAHLLYFFPKSQN